MTWTEAPLVPMTPLEAARNHLNAKHAAQEKLLLKTIAALQAVQQAKPKRARGRRGRWSTAPKLRGAGALSCCLPTCL